MEPLVDFHNSLGWPEICRQGEPGVPFFLHVKTTVHHMGVAQKNLGSLGTIDMAAMLTVQLSGHSGHKKFLSPTNTLSSDVRHFCCVFLLLQLDSERIFSDTFFGR